MSEMMKLKRAA